MAQNVNQMQCTDLCLSQFNCLGADYNSADQSCWFHGVATECTALVVCSVTVHLTAWPVLLVLMSTMYSFVYV